VSFFFPSGEVKYLIMIARNVDPVNLDFIAGGGLRSELVVGVVDD
jgi:hypothetical protein